MSNKIYFPGLNGLRFFSSLAVFVTHVELMKAKLGYSNFWHNTLIHYLGVIGVSFFFVLSGFLITFLMLTEKKHFKLFSLKKFYLRRVLRIWPLYFLLLIIGFFILPYYTYVPYFSDHFKIEFSANLILYILIIPNLALSMFVAVPLIGQSWSIGVEEQFYFFWPILFRLFKGFNYKLLVNFLVFWVLLKLIVLITILNYDYPWLLILKNNLAMLKFENMVIGAIGALLLFENKTNILNFIHNKIILGISLIGIFISLYVFPDFLFDGIHLVHSVFFLVIILNVSSNQKSFVKLENKFYNNLGRISYGIYMYHLIIIYFGIKIFDYFNIFLQNNIFFNILLYVFSLLITISLSYISYNLFEKQFLKIKDRFSMIESSN